MTHWDAGGNFRAFYLSKKKGKTLNLGIGSVSHCYCVTVNFGCPEGREGGSAVSKHSHNHTFPFSVLQHW